MDLHPHVRHRHRSVRGIEAVVAGFSPTPVQAQAVVKQPEAQQGFYTLAARFSQ